MKKTFLLSFICLLITVCKAQSYFPHYAINKVVKGKEDHLLLRTNDDLLAISTNPDAFSHVNSVSIDGNININDAIVALYGLVEVFELKLRNYEGKIRPFGGDSLDLFEDIVYYMTYENSEDLETLDNFPKQTALTIIHPGPVVEEFYLLNRIKKSKRVNILGDFLKPDMDSIAMYIAKQKQIVHLGLGLDYITDIPKRILKMPNLKSLTVFDNASHVKNIEYIDYPMDRRYMTYNVKERSRTIELKFFSERSKLEPYDIFYLQEISPKSKFDKTSPKNNMQIKPEFYTWSKLARDTVVSIDYASHAHPAANLPVPYLNPTVEYFEIDPTKNAIIYTKNGTELKISANAIIRQNGQPIKGKVVVSFANLSDATNSFLAGLKLSTRRKGVEIQLNPLNSFEIKAFESGNLVKLKAKESIKATFVLPRDTFFSQYILDPIKRTWRPMTGYYYASKLNKVKEISYANWKNGENTNSYFPFDNTNFNERYTTPEYFFLMGKEHVKRNFDKRKGLKFHNYSTHYFYSDNKQSIGVKKGKKLIKIIKVPREEGEDKTVVKTQIVDVFDNYLFRELRAFKKYVFKTKYLKGRREFSKEFTTKKRYFDVRIIYAIGASTGIIELKEENGYKHLSFFIPNEEKEEFIKYYEKYQYVLNLREKEFNKVLENKESKFKYGYFENRKKEGFKEYSATLTEFGIYSNANEISIEKEKEIIANFTDKDGIPIDLKRCYIFHKNNNSIYAYTDGNIVFDKNNIAGIICTDHKGEVYFLDGEIIASLNLEDYSYSVIKMYRLEAPVKTAEEFKRHVGIE